MARCSVVLLNWNSGELGARAAASVRAQTVPCELVVVDNASTDDSLDRILALTEPDRLILERSNLGFATGMDHGIAATRTPYVLPLNCDAVLDPDYVERLVAVLDAEPDVAVAGGAVRLVDSLDPGAAVDRIDGPLEITLTTRTRRLPTDVACDCDKVNGACPVQRRAALDQVVDRRGAGPFDPSYDTYGEDIDLALELASLGWRIRYEPGAGAAHLRSFSSARRTADKRGRLRVNVLRNRHRNIARHRRGATRVAATVVALAQDVGFALVQLTRGDRRVIADVRAAWGQAYGVGRRKHPIERRVRASARIARAGALDLVDRARGRVDDDLPPRRLRDVGGGDFRRTGLEFRDHLRRFVRLTPHDRVLDLGCGIGRMALPLAEVLEPPGSYLGLDIVPSAIEWCRANITPDHPHVRFELLDAANSRYRADGPSASSIRLPVDDSSIDVVVMASVATHLLPDDLAHYLAEVGRVLDRGGRALITAFLLDADEVDPLLDAGRAELPFGPRRGTVRVVDSDLPESAIAHDRDWFLDRVTDAGLRVRQTHPGSWPGRDPQTCQSYQDMLVLERP